MSHIKYQVSNYTENMQKSTIIFGIITFIFMVYENVNNIQLLGITNITFSIFILGLSIKELNLYKKSKDKLELLLGLILIVFFIVKLYIGISEVQNWFY